MEDLDLESAEALLQQQGALRNKGRARHDEEKRRKSAERSSKGKHSYKEGKTIGSSSSHTESKGDVREGKSKNDASGNWKQGREYAEEQRKGEKKNKKVSRSRSRSRSNRKSKKKKRSSSSGGKRNKSEERKNKKKQLQLNEEELLKRKEVEEHMEQKIKEAEEAKRDDLTVLILSLPMKSTEAEIYQFFRANNCGKIRDIRIIKDPKNGRSKGIAYVEFYNEESTLYALSLTDREFLNTNTIIKIQPSQAEKNRAYIASKNYRITHLGNTEESKDLYSGKVFIDGLVDQLADIQERDINEIFSPFGEIEFIDLRKDAISGRCKGFALLQYKNHKDAEAAIKEMNNFVINEKKISVSNQPHGSMLGSSNQPGERFSNPSPVIREPLALQPDPAQNLHSNKDLDYEEGSSLFLHSAQSRYLLMQKLTRENPQATNVNPAPNQDYLSFVEKQSDYMQKQNDLNETRSINSNTSDSNSKKKESNYYDGMPIIQTQAGPKRVIPEANIFVKNIDPSISVKQLESVFSMYGNILSCKIACDGGGHSLGYGYVQFDKKESADLAISQANNTKLKEMVITVQPFISKINRLDPKNNIYIKNLPMGVADDELNQKLCEIFGRYGPITSSMVRIDKIIGRPYAFICYEEHGSAELAIQSMQNTDPFGSGTGMYISWAEKKPERVKRLTEMNTQNLLTSILGYNMTQMK